MRVITFWNVKGGVGKTTSSTNFAVELTRRIREEKSRAKVLFVDLDPQSNASEFFGFNNEENPEQLHLAHLMLDENVRAKDVIVKTKYRGLDLIPTMIFNYSIDKDLLLSGESDVEYRLKNKFKEIESRYDYCVIDCPPAPSITTLNGLVITNDLLLPLKIDEFGIKGLSYVYKTIGEVQAINPELNFFGAFITMYQNSSIDKDGEAFLKEELGEKLLDTHIRNAVKVRECSITKKPLVWYKTITAGRDYRSLVDEYLTKQ